MVQRIGGTRRKTRNKLKKGFRRKGKLSLTRYFQTFNKGDKVSLVAEPSVQKGLYFRRFHGLIGTIEGTQGNCYKVKLKDSNKYKTVIVHPVHLKKV